MPPAHERTRKTKDGTEVTVKVSAPNKRTLTELFLQKLKPKPRGGYMVWDEKQAGLAISVRPSGHLSWKVIYSHHGKPRWYTIGNARAIGLAEARKLASEVMYRVAKGEDPAADKRAERTAGTFEELATKYVDQYAKKKNKSWKQADALVKKYLLPNWRALRPADIARSDVKGLLRTMTAPVLANQVLASASAIFSWAIKEEVGGVTQNPCRLIDRNETKSRERILSDSEVATFWTAFDTAGLYRSTALKLILLTGQRPGEVSYMRREHIIDGWWEMPGKPVSALRWPGTKNGQSHRVWLPQEAKRLIAMIDDDATTGFVLHGQRPINQLDSAMRNICTDLNIGDGVRPHDLRRTHGSTITRLGFGREAMNRVQNHKDGGIASVYDRHQYSEENKKIMEAVAQHILALASGTPSEGKVVPLRRG
jgi:integrase